MTKSDKIHALFLKANSKQFSNFRGDYMFSYVSVADSPAIDKPLRTNGLRIVVCLNGSMSVNINQTIHELLPHTIMALGPNDMFCVKSVSSDFEAYVLSVSPSFLENLNIDINVLQNISMRPRDVVCLTLDAQEMDVVSCYLNLLHGNASNSSDSPISLNISRCLITALFYKILEISHKHIYNPDMGQGNRHTHACVAEFVRLLSLHFKEQHTVSFYAKQMCLSPKYVSTMVKQATGRSAAEWIDTYLILEAKNMIRFSDKTFQQVAYELHFASQSTFGKYFKQQTGMSPTEFQRS